MPLQTSPDPQADDLLEPVLPPNAARRLILASDVLGYASRTELERLGITFVRRAAPGAEAAAAAAEMPALVLRQLPILLGLHQHARHRISLRALYRAAAALAIGLGDEKGLLDELLADWPIEEPGS